MSKKLLQFGLNREQPLAFICSPRLGDTLISLVTVNNLVRNGFVVDVYGDYAYQLKDWFSWARIHAKITVENAALLKQYSQVLHMYDSPLSDELKKWHKNSVVLSDSLLYHLPQSMVDIQVQLCREELGLQDVVRENNLKALPGLIASKNPKRVIINPTSFLTRKNWPKNKFIKLAQILTQRSFEVHFIVAPNEYQDWQDVEQYGFIVQQFNSLSAVASYLCEAAFFIGNDSGLGHLASNLGVPTLSIILRKGVARQWRPSWAPNVTVLSPSWLNPRPIKEKLWKIFISVKRVLRGFERLYAHEFEDFFINPDNFLKRPEFILIKGDKRDSTMVFVATLKQQRFVIKRYNVKNFWVMVKNIFRRSHAFYAWNNSYKLISLGINVPQPIAYYEKRHGIFYSESYFIAEYVAGVRGCDYFAPSMPFLPAWKAVVENITDITRKLRQARLVHRDFQYGNMLIVDSKVYLLDLEHLNHYLKYNFLFNRSFNRDIQHFLDFVRSNHVAYELFKAQFITLESRIK